jgi:hypothetical protein
MTRERTWETRWLVTLILGMIVLLGIGLVARAAASRGFYWADDYQHLQISRLALKDPSWILDVWGRPLMTLAYMPAAPWGDGAVRATSLVFPAITAAACAGIARRLDMSIAPAAALLLIAQPLTATIGYSALPATIFSLVLAIALWLRVAGHHVAAVLVVSFLPLARLEGLLVLGVWALVLAWERRVWLYPFLCVGVALWAAAGALCQRYCQILWIGDCDQAARSPSLSF